MIPGGIGRPVLVVSFVAVTAIAGVFSLWLHEHDRRKRAEDHVHQAEVAKKAALDSLKLARERYSHAQLHTDTVASQATHAAGNYVHARGTVGNHEPKPVPTDSAKAPVVAAGDVLVNGNDTLYVVHAEFIHAADAAVQQIGSLKDAMMLERAAAEHRFAVTDSIVRIQAVELKEWKRIARRGFGEKIKDAAIGAGIMKLIDETLLSKRGN